MERFNRIEKKLRGLSNVSDRIATRQWDESNSDYFNGDSSSSGSGDALASILSAVGAGVQAGANVYQASQYGAPTPGPTPIYTNAVSAHATGSGSSLIWVIVLALVGVFAYKNL
jgi:hypothetical protein